MRDIIRAVGVCLFLMLNTQLSADTLTVNKNGTAMYSTIQSAITDADQGDTIIVETGTYYENINMAGKAVTLRSLDPDNPSVVAQTILNGSQIDTVIACSTNEGADTLIEGFYITGGGGADVYGIGYEYSGGGVYINDASPTIRNCTFVANSADDYGGGIYICQGSPTIADCTFSQNIAMLGGGIYNYIDATPTIMDCLFFENAATDYAGGIGSTFSNPILERCVFIENTAAFGGGMRNYFSSPRMTNCIFSENRSIYYGGGMYNCASDPNILQCTFTENVSGYYGGGMDNYCNSSPLVTNCIFSGNTAVYGAGMHSEDSSPAIRFCLFIGNEAGECGGGMRNHFSSSTIVENSIIRNCLPEQIANVECTPQVRYCCIQGGYSGEGNVDVNPMFVSDGYWDGDEWVEGDYHLKSHYGRWDYPNHQWVIDAVTSPLIDAGDPAMASWHNELWPNGGRANIGCFGGNPQASMSSNQIGHIADLSHDGTIGTEDFVQFCDQWLVQEDLIDADFDRDGDVDLGDFASLTDNWHRSGL